MVQLHSFTSHIESVYCPFQRSDHSSYKTITKEFSADFSKELVTAARAHIDKKAIYHQNFAGNCIESPSEWCFANGLGPDTFDCSGLIAKSISDVLGIDAVEQAQKSRHVRDMWLAAHNQDVFHMAEFARGALLVTRRRYTIDKKPVSIPGHIGIISNTHDSGFDLIQTNTLTGKVEEKSFGTLNTIMGCIALIATSSHQEEGIE